MAEQEPQARGLQGPRTPGCLPGVGGQKLKQWPSPWPGPNGDTQLLWRVLLVRAALTPRTRNRLGGTVGPQSSSLQGFGRGLPLQETQWPRLISNYCKCTGAAPSRNTAHITFL